MLSNKKAGQLPHIAITAGEPAGIGPDLCVLLSAIKFDARLTVIADQTLIAHRAKQLGVEVNLLPYQSEIIKSHQGDGHLTILHRPTKKNPAAGQLNKENSHYVLEMLHTALQGCLTQEFDAMVTAPVHKGVINDAGIAFSGHTEFLAEQSHTPKLVMMLVGSGLRVALVTTHLALKDVPGAITEENVETSLRILHQDLIEKFGIPQPRILVAGLNPHAGENGYLGSEEITVINPVISKLKKAGMQLTGALPADTLFAKHHLKNADAVLAMYHDQGLPVLKHASFGEGVNVTLGLPVIRTSVDHGTALDLAGTGKINIGSMVSAIELAISLANNKTVNLSLP